MSSHTNSSNDTYVYVILYEVIKSNNLSEHKKNFSFFFLVYYVCVSKNHFDTYFRLSLTQNFGHNFIKKN